MLYDRLEKAGRLLGADLDDAHVRASLQVAQLAQDLTGEEPFSSAPLAPQARGGDPDQGRWTWPVSSDPTPRTGAEPAAGADDGWSSPDGS